MLTLKNVKKIPFPTLRYPLDTKENRAINVAKSMHYQIKRLDITIKDEKFLLSFAKSLNEVERDPSAPYLCFDCDPQRTAKFLQRFQSNLSESGQNFSLSKLGYLLALTLGFDKYDALLRQLEAYQCFIEKPWHIGGKKITKPVMSRDYSGVYVHLPIVSIAARHSSLFQDISVSKIRANHPKFIGRPIIFSYKTLYHGCEFRNFGATEEDAMAWLIVHAVHQLRDIKLWHIELKFYRATLRYQNETADYM
ncbi:MULTISPECIES: hypothetical protein [unclassified Pseudoalteromonas]|uniref:hypothetical protein n=1 Tax=unclassified Pseudoalteromonas TaxID=194690 RepID=UPI0023599659|nr:MULTISPECIES: hypothetical protein [unclassified Pseudoalteromonas]MDC9498757.1 hypothetical protein [Pseudoalteromonas sp. Angola-20]MDC9518570.1 hypothetical protein [Pseudoalteromonas sp. Angola-22]MDC9534977.1 hypothetical protein [Pseudoalteromonas sp. Angola-9]